MKREQIIIMQIIALFKIRIFDRYVKYEKKRGEKQVNSIIGKQNTHLPLREMINTQFIINLQLR